MNLVLLKRISLAALCACTTLALAALLFIVRWKSTRSGFAAFDVSRHERLLALPLGAMSTTVASIPRTPASSMRGNEIPKGRLRMVNDPPVHLNERSITVPVLMYHYIRPITPTMSHASVWLSVSPEHFRAQMKEIVDFGYHPVTPDELYDAISTGAALPAHPVLMTFDDGYRDQYTEAFPVLKKLNLKATFFIVSGYMATSVTPYMTREMVRELDTSGLATIAAHTKHHVGLVDTKPAQRHDEIFGSKKELEALVRHPVTAFAYPYGNFNGAVRAQVGEAGYHTAFSTLLGSVHTSSSRLELRRIRVLDDEKLEPILRKFSR